jgi:hypothetical protein
MYGLCLDGIFVVKKEIKRLLGSFFLFFSWIDFCDFFAFLGNRPLKNSLRLLLQNLREEAFSTFTLHNTPYWVDERERRGLQRARDGKSKTRVCVSSVVRSKEREREREKLYCRILLLVEIENGKKRGTSLVDQREKNETRESDTVHGGNDGADDGAEEKQLRHEQVHAGVRFVG